LTELARVYAEAARCSIPVEVMIELTGQCNFRCRHCYNPDHQVREMLSATCLVGLLEELAEMGTLVLGLSGGEPLLRHEWVCIAKRARQLGFDLHVFTNGSTISAPQAEQLAELFATVHVSFYSTNEGTFDWIVGTAGAFRRVLRGLEELRARDVSVVLMVPLLEPSYRDLADVRSLAASLGAECRSAPVILPMRSGDPAPLGLRVPPTELLRADRGLALGCRPAPMGNNNLPLCAAGSRSACVTAEGNVLACTALPMSAGNLHGSTFRKIWTSSPWLQRLRATAFDDLVQCRGCKARSACLRCPALALTEDGNLLGPSRWACELAAALTREAAARA
jgi:radical SAM protein with 4Fe4S-binding SPASM domain